MTQKFKVGDRVRVVVCNTMEIVGHVSKPTQLMLWIEQAVHGVMPEKKGAK
ncbi:hypothetical protein [Listeria booriae]|uniref:hypothetical protein n=1 Tax=Listeria booriae TaxID=1552123 RepID=UPI00163DC91D|nr:hypothetical protein [Listeria booriae]MBC1306839.1 hypothetical protein [Listeria booriae]